VEAQEECFSVLERLFECLENVILRGRPIHGTELHGEVVDEVLTFTVNYDGFVLKEQTETSMEEVGVVTDVKG
jgi:hypothetical protein